MCGVEHARAFVPPYKLHAVFVAEREMCSMRLCEVCVESKYFSVITLCDYSGSWEFMTVKLWPSVFRRVQGR